MQKEFVKVDCNSIACMFFGKCCKCATEIVRMRENDSSTDLMLIGQGAGAEEDQVGLPFQGRAGRLLRKDVKPILVKDQLNIILDNTIRSRPLDEKGKNRAPTDKELEFCKEILWQRIDKYQPRVIIPLGASATGTLIPEFKKLAISKCRGKVKIYNGYTFLPTFHPAAILHATEEELKISLEKFMISDIEDAVKLAKEESDLI